MNIIRFDIMNVSPQTNSQDCGVYAIAYATELAHGAHTEQPLSKPMLQEAGEEQQEI